VLNLKPAPEFEQWLRAMQIFEDSDRVALNNDIPAAFRHSLSGPRRRA